MQSALLLCKSFVSSRGLSASTIEINPRLREMARRAHSEYVTHLKSEQTRKKLEAESAALQRQKKADLEELEEKKKRKAELKRLNEEQDQVGPTHYLTGAFVNSCCKYNQRLEIFNTVT